MSTISNENIMSNIDRKRKRRHVPPRRISTTTTTNNEVTMDDNSIIDMEDYDYSSISSHASSSSVSSLDNQYKFPSPTKRQKNTTVIDSTINNRLDTRTTSQDILLSRQPQAISLIPSVSSNMSELSRNYTSSSNSNVLTTNVNVTETNNDDTTRICTRPIITPTPSQVNLSSSSLPTHTQQQQPHVVDSRPIYRKIDDMKSTTTSNQKMLVQKTISDENITILKQQQQLQSKSTHYYNRFRSSSSFLTILCTTILTMMILIIVILSLQQSSIHIPLRNNNNTNIDTIYVSGGGFSGFWFTLGRLQNSIKSTTTRTTTTMNHENHSIHNSTFMIHNTTTSNNNLKEYYCYSSGCLGVVAALSHYTMEEMYDIAYHIQLLWKHGTISRYDVVTTFVDHLLFGPNNNNTDSNINSNSSLTETTKLNMNDLSSLRIITSMKNGYWGIKPCIRTPKTINELRIMLIQTTWIPYIIGNTLYYKNHMDGAFTTLYHPKCKYNVGLQYDIDLYSNILNVNLNRIHVEQFWYKGLQYGL